MKPTIDNKSEIEVLLQSGTLNSFMAGALFRLNYQFFDEKTWDDALEEAIEASKAEVNSDEELAEFLAMPPKLAYPNTGKVYKALPKYDLQKWASLAARIRESVKMGFVHSEAITEASTELGMPERLDFLDWYGLHTGSSIGKYNINEEIRQKSNQRSVYAEGVQMEFTKIAELADERHYYLPRLRNEAPVQVEPVSQYTPSLPGQIEPRPPQWPTGIEQNAKDFESARQKLVGRTFSIDKLLEKYKKVLSPDQVDGIEDSLNELRKKIRKLKLAASIRDSMVKTAGIIGLLDFTEGERELLSLAADEASMPTPLAAPVDTMSTQKKNEELAKIVELLNMVSVTLKSRDLIRSIAEIDIRLNDLRMSSFFPEMQDAQAKLIDAFGYASNKIEDALPKLRGGLIGQQEAGPVTPIGKTDEESLQQLQEITKKPKKQAPSEKAPVEPVQVEKKEEVLPAEPTKKVPVLPEEEETDSIRDLQLPVRR